MKKNAHAFLYRIMALWALLSFSISFLIVLIPSLLCGLLPNPSGQTWFIRIARIWMRIWMPLVGCPPRLIGEQNFRAGQSYIVVCNHNSLMDPPMSSAFIPGPNKTIAKASFTKVPLFGWYYRLGGVMVDRKSEDSRRKSIENMRRVLENGMHMCIYPEGTRNRTDQPFKSFYDGAFKLAIDSGHSILPAVIFHTRTILPPQRFFYFVPHPIVMEFLTPVSPVGETVESLKEKVFQLMWERYGNGPSRNL
ncbi:MAG: 1-acyl-sn-glycerol-3-phosphate acyltransferase [Bacteroidetes bacterium]|nr:1-acyl-sn-glycerol-3-phosphate acyltransferase [Bacteroidota bacterium]